VRYCNNASRAFTLRQKTSEVLYDRVSQVSSGFGCRNSLQRRVQRWRAGQRGAACAKTRDLGAQPHDQIKRRPIGHVSGVACVVNSGSTDVKKVLNLSCTVPGVDTATLKGTLSFVTGTGKGTVSNTLYHEIGTYKFAKA
jgi:hypothetical protein